MIKRIVSIWVLILLGLLAACGTPAAPEATQSQIDPVQVFVTLTEFKIETTLKNFQKGQPYRFVISNRGTVAHEFVILPQGAQHDMSSMPGMGGDNTAGSDDGREIIMLSESELPPGATKTVDLVFKEDTHTILLEMACHVPGHYEAGMQLGIAVN